MEKIKKDFVAEKMVERRHLTKNDKKEAERILKIYGLSLDAYMEHAVYALLDEGDLPFSLIYQLTDFGTEMMKKYYPELLYNGSQIRIRKMWKNKKNEDIAQIEAPLKIFEEQ